MRGTYFRWTRDIRTNELIADILSSNIEIVSDGIAGVTKLQISNDTDVVRLTLNADEARMIGVRLIESAALSDDSAIRDISDVPR